MAEIGFQVSTKTNDGTIFVIAAADFGKFQANLQQSLGSTTAEALLNRMAASFEGQPLTTDQIAEAFGGTVIQSDKWGQAPASAPASAGPVCKHGEPAKQVPAGVSKSTGKPYRAFYACSRPQGQQCDFRANAS